MLHFCHYLQFQSNTAGFTLASPFPHLYLPSPKARNPALIIQTPKCSQFSDKCCPLHTGSNCPWGLTTLGHLLHLGFPNGFLIKERKKAINMYLEKLRGEKHESGKEEKEEKIQCSNVNTITLKPSYHVHFIGAEDFCSILQRLRKRITLSANNWWSWIKPREWTLGLQNQSS